MKVARFCILVTLLFSFCMVVAHEEPPKTKKEKAEANAKQEKMMRNGISQVTIWRHNIENGIVSDAKEKYAELNYNDKGLNTSILVYSHDSLKYKTVNVFDFDGNRILDFDYEVEKPAGNAIFQYSEEGLIRKIINIDSAGNVVSEDEYFWNPKALTITLKSVKNSGILDYSYTYFYNTSDFSGNCIGIEHRDSTGKLVMRVENVFDENNIRQEKKIFNSDNKLDYKFSYTYTPGGDFSVITKIDADGKIMKTDTYTYNDKGILTTVESKDANGIVTDKLSYEYSFDFVQRKTETPNKK